ncbi:MAG: Exodeoxyribonuclease 7 large subunit [Eubacteriales bacterium SKADARSKE-1]|nr:Exodeoxyribonuclease 7 large subunit [Eubacteriales bacterium SKADARSKE-1]
MANINVLTISQLNCYIKSILDSDVNLNNVFLVGEISNLTNHYQSGHIYFSLKDEKCTVRAVAFFWYAKSLRFKPANGMKVIVRGKISVYETTGVYQILVEDMQPEGLGALNLAFEQLKTKLSSEGLFDKSRKKEIPRFPKKVGVITAKTGAAFWDIQSILKRRLPLIEILFYPVLVQGNEAPKQIIEAINLFNNSFDAEVLIVGRGGGSIEDLWAFNDEGVARAVANSKVPIISAVGHETDFTICDFVADLRAPTPSAAAELVSPDQNELMHSLGYLVERMKELAKKKLQVCTNRLQSLLRCERLINQKSLIDAKRLKMEVLMGELNITFIKIVDENKNRFLSLSSKLDVLSPLKILKSGYSVVLSNENKVVRSINKVKQGEQVNIRLNDGVLNCKVESIVKGEL